MSLGLAQNAAASATSSLFADISKTSAVQSLVQRVEDGGVLACSGVCPSAQPFFAALLRRILPNRTLVAVTPDLKTQENFQQDIETWLAFGGAPGAGNRGPFDSGAQPLFYPPWEVLPHEGRLPHADTISDRRNNVATGLGQM